jgi:hypothetical protein
MEKTDEALSEVKRLREDLEEMTEFAEFLVGDCCDWSESWEQFEEDREAAGEE